MEGFLSSAKGMRGKINMVAVITAFFLSIMNIMTYNSCTKKGQTPDQFEKESKTMWILSIIILILACLLFGYDLAVMFNLI